MTATISFKTKGEPCSDMDGNHFTVWKVPTLTRNHCDMAAFRRHSRYGAYANSDLFPSLLRRIRDDLAPSGYLQSHKLPPNVTVDTSGYLAVITIELR
jgi:hypothetical protein